MGKRRVKREEHAVYKNNFWNQVRKERGVTFKYIGDILGRSATMVRYYFIGKQMPPPEHIKLMCEGFNVDIEQGTEEFKKMHKEWKMAHGKSATIQQDKSCSFWKQKLKDAKINYKELSEIVNVPYSTLKAYFSGFALPTPEKIKNICALLDVDSDFGEAEFIRLNIEWGEHHPDYQKYGNTYRRIVAKDTSKSKSTKSVASDTPDNLELLYGKLTYKDFKKIEAMYDDSTKFTDILRYLYDIIDFDTFMSIVGVSVYG